MSSATLMKTMAMDIALVSPKMVAAFGIAVVVILSKKFMFLDKKSAIKKVSIECKCNIALFYSSFINFFLAIRKKSKFAILTFE